MYCNILVIKTPDWMAVVQPNTGKHTVDPTVTLVLV